MALCHRLATSIASPLDTAHSPTVTLARPRRPNATATIERRRRRLARNLQKRQNVAKPGRSNSHSRTHAQRLDY